MTLALASSTMQGLSMVFMTVCLTLKALRIIDTVNLLVAIAMGAALLACSGILAQNAYMAGVMLTIHLVSALLVTAVTRERPWWSLPRSRQRRD